MIKKLKYFFNGGFINERFKARYFPVIVIVFLVGIFKISMMRITDAKVKEISKLKDDLKKIETQYLKQEQQIYNKRLESKLKEKVQRLGLKPMVEQPITIKPVPWYVSNQPWKN